jgi:hypothetical protein
MAWIAKRQERYHAYCIATPASVPILRFTDWLQMTKPDDKPKRGGPRPGAGPKPLPPELKRKPYALRLSPDIFAFLKSQASATAAIETTIRRSKAFRDWLKNNS